ncbi:MAG: CRTAC1 family protein [Bacteroidota bacterium]
MRSVSLLTLMFGILLVTTSCEKAPASEQPAASETAIPFTLSQATAEAGLANFTHATGASGEKWFPETMGSGAAIVDIDNDGWQDILLVGGATWTADDTTPALLLYRNNQDGSFSDISKAAGLSGMQAYGFGVATADYDNDGDQDIALTTLEGTRLLQNNEGVFINVSRQAGLAVATDWHSTALFFDADRDGWLDLYLGGYVDWSPEDDIFCTLDGTNKSYCTPELYNGTPGTFFYNNGDGTFSDQTAARGFADAPGKTLGAAMLDYNKDGAPDLIVSNDTQRDLLYENDGTGIFTEKGQLSGIAFDENGKARAGMGIDTGFIDGGNDETVFVGNFSKEMIAVYHHIGDGLFVDRAARSKIGRPSLLTLTFGLALLDIDLDADLDLFTANGHLQVEIENTQEGIAYKQTPHLFLNDGTGVFSDVADRLTNFPALVGRGIAYGDLDNDGDLDVLITENGGPAFLWRNDLSQAANYLRIKLAGTSSNRDALGSLVELYAGGTKQIRYTRTGSSYLSQSETIATFGLNITTVVDSLRITWPSGKQQLQTNVQANQLLMLTEPQ